MEVTVITYEEFMKIAEKDIDKFIYPHDCDEMDKLTLRTIDTNRMFRKIVFSEEVHKFLETNFMKTK